MKRIIEFIGDIAFEVYWFCRNKLIDIHWKEKKK